MPLEQVLKAIEKHDGEEFARHLTADCEFRAPGFEATGPAQTWPWMTAFLDAFPDIDHRVVTSVASGDREAAEVVISGTHTQALVSAQGTIPATGKTMTIHACDMVQLDDAGRIRSYHIYFDQVGFLAQLGLM